MAQYAVRTKSEIETIYRLKGRHNETFEKTGIEIEQKPVKQLT